MGRPCHFFFSSLREIHQMFRRTTHLFLVECGHSVWEPCENVKVFCTVDTISVKALCPVYGRHREEGIVLILVMILHLLPTFHFINLILIYCASWHSFTILDQRKNIPSNSFVPNMIKGHRLRLAGHLLCVLYYNMLLFLQCVRLYFVPSFLTNC